MVLDFYEAFKNGTAKPIHEKVKLDVKIFQEKCGAVAVSKVCCLHAVRGLKHQTM